LLVVIFSSCQKTIEPTVGAKETAPKEIIITETSKFLVDGKDYLTYSEYFAKYKNQNNFIEDEEEIIIDFTDSNYIFTSESALYAWTFTKPSAELIRQKLDSAILWQNYATSRNMLDDSLATDLYADSILQDDFSKGSPALFFSGLYSDPNYTGTFYWYPLISFRPSLGSFNRRASSVADFYLFPKLNMLAAKTWFRGSKLFYWSWRTIPNLRTLNYDNIASSKL
jgi:hypothetical protein